MTSKQHARHPLRAAVWRTARRAAAALAHIHNEQTLMWELQWQASRAAVAETGPLTWILTLDGDRLAGSHLPVPGDTTAGGIR